MTDQTAICEPSRTALLLMDFQPGILAHIDGSEALLARVAVVARAAREAGVRVGYVRVAFRPGHPEISPRNKSFAAHAGTDRLILDSPDTQVHPDLTPHDREFVVVKHRVGAFGNTDLDQLLRAGGIETIVLAGISTSGVVLSTVRDAADRDYRIVVLGDCVADRDAEVHRVLLEKVFPRQAEVMDSAEFVAQLA